MKKLSGFLFFVFFALNSLFSQVNKDGLPFITQYTDKDYGDVGQVWAITQDNRGVMYFGCNYGLKTYDGKVWKSYNNPNSTIIRSLTSDDDGIVYYGAEGDFGIILPNDEGELTFHSLFLDKFNGDSINFGSVWKTLIAGNKIYFQAFEQLFYCDLPLKFENNKLINDINVVFPENQFHLSFSVDNDFYIRDWAKGMCLLKDGKAELIPGGEKFAMSRVYVMLPYDDTKILIGTREEGFFLYDKTKKKNAVKPFNIGDNKEIINSTIYYGTKISNGNFVIATYADGIFVIDKKGNIVNHFNGKTGMPDAVAQVVYYNDKDPNAQLWTFFQDHGIFRLDVSGPFTQWTKAEGLEGIPYDIFRFNNKIYLAASPYLYVLKKGKYYEFEKIYGEPGYYIWDLYQFKVPGSNKKKLLLGTFSGIFEVKDSTVTKISDLKNAYAMLQSEKDSTILFVGGETGLSKIQYKNSKWSNVSESNKELRQSRSILEKNGNLYFGILGTGVKKITDFEDKNPILLDSSRGLPLLGNDYFLHQIKDKVVIVSGSGFNYITNTDSVRPFDIFGNHYCDGTKGVYRFSEDTDAYWMSVYNNDAQNLNHTLIRFLDKNKLTKDSVFAGILPQKSTFCIYPDGNYVWVGNERGLFKFNKKIQKNYKSSFNTLITKVVTANDSVLFAGNFSEKENNSYKLLLSQPESKIPELSFSHNLLIFEWAAPFFEKETETEYSFRLVGESEEWSKWTRKTDTRFTNLYEGDYTFEVKARNIYNTESTIAQYSFTVLPPWYRTIWAYILFLIAGIFAILLIIKLYTKKLKRENEKLEQIVKERTAEIRMQNEEITAQRDEIQAQKDVVEKAKDKIEKQQKSIMDSIHYASRIQEAVLPPDEYLNKILGEHFVLFRPRDIVSGDFYWATERGNKTVIVAADCTGHGVPGAFMSMLGMSFLNEIVNKDGILQANVILNRLRENVKKSLRQTGKENEAKDGMDIAVCIIDKTEMKLQFAGAYNPLLIIRNDEISRIKADRMPIGIYLREKESFTNNIIDIKKGDLLYIFSDGYVDQFGGENDSKIRSATFKEILLANHKKPLGEQKAALVKFLEEWMDHVDKTGRKYKQVDDILVIGIEI